jgi:hypothetical protein
MNKLAIIGIAAVLVIATAVIATVPQALANDRGDRTVQRGECGSCQQNQATNNDDSLNTEASSDGDHNTVEANGGQFNSR